MYVYIYELFAAIHSAHAIQDLAFKVGNTTEGIIHNPDCSGIYPHWEVSTIVCFL